jgi:DNA replication protein DnaD
MLEYQKMILEKVAFNKSLFEKELRKSTAMLSSNEAQDLRAWIISNYSTTHADIIRRAFAYSSIVA